MQVVISLPERDELKAAGGVEQALFRQVCGIPLLTRVIATAGRSGGTRFLLLSPKSLPEERLRSSLNSPLLSSLAIETCRLESAFDPDNTAAWRAIESRLAKKFLWLPWNYVVDRKSLSQLIEVGETSSEGARFVWPDQAAEKPSPGVSRKMPAVVIAKKLTTATDSATEMAGALSRVLGDGSLAVVAVSKPPGTLVHSSRTARLAAAELVRRSGKDTDGVFSTFNRRLCRPMVRWLTKTPLTPNLVTFAGLMVAIGSGYWYAQGHYAAYVFGGLLYFVSVLFDEMDGMLARLTFRESAFGCWLETFVDYASYLILFAGMTIGLSRESGLLWLALGGLLLIGTFISFFVVSHQRKLATDPDRPNEYLSRIHRQLEADSSHLLSRFGRLTEFVIRKAPLSHFIPLFSLLGGLKVFFSFAAFGSNVVWLVALSYNRLFRSSSETLSNTNCRTLYCSPAEEGR